MPRSIWTIVVSVWLATSSILGAAEEGRTLPRIGVVIGSNPSASKPYGQAFLEGLRDLGYVEGKSFVILSRYADGDNSRFPGILAELIGLNVDVLVVTPTAARPAKLATSTIPIVLPSHGDPVGHGLVASLAHPGGNITGLSSSMVETEPKRLELAMEVLPGLKRLGLMFESVPEITASLSEESAFGALARRNGVMLRRYAVSTLGDIQNATRRAAQDRLQGVIVVNTSLLVLYRDLIIEGLTVQRVPVISGGRDMAESGALLTYSPDFLDMWKRSASYVDRILRGAKPGDLPIEQPTKFGLIVNLKSARALGITIPQSILVRADEVIR